MITDENGQQSSVDIPFVYDEEALKAINSYAIGYIYIPSIDIRLPMVQYTDNDYYLHHLIDGTYNSIEVVQKTFSFLCSSFSISISFT